MMKLFLRSYICELITISLCITSVCVGLTIFSFLSCRQEAEKEVHSPPGTYALLEEIQRPTTVPDISYAQVSDSALVVCRKTVLYLLARIPEVKDILISKGVKVVIIGSNEVTTDIPEYNALNQLFPGTDWDRRTRGIGATTLIPVSSCAEENLLCFESDPYKGEDILIHEFAHTIHTMGLRYLDANFDKALQSIYRMAKREGLWKNTYAITNYVEYFAEGVQSWFNVNMEARPVDEIEAAALILATLSRKPSILFFNILEDFQFLNDEKISDYIGNSYCVDSHNQPCYI